MHMLLMIINEINAIPSVVYDGAKNKMFKNEILFQFYSIIYENASFHMLPVFINYINVNYVLA